MLTTLREAVSYSTVARIYNVSPKYVINHFDKHSNQLSINRENVEHLSIDELRFMNKNEANYQFIIVNTYTKEVLDIISDRTQKNVKKFLETNYYGIKTVSQDLWKPYKNAVLSIYEDAKIVPDRFHIVRQFTWAFSRERIQLQKEHGIKTNKCWRLLTIRESKLDEKGKEKSDRKLSESEYLKVIHLAKEKAYDTFKKQTLEEYREKLQILKEYVELNDIVEFKRALNTIKNWEEDIENMFRYDISNGIVERINRFIKQYKDISYGFKNLERSTKLVKYRVNKLKILGLMISNALVSLSGALFTQYIRVIDLSSSVGTMVIGLASIIFGLGMLKKSNVINYVSIVIVGSIVYYIVINFALNSSNITEIIFTALNFSEQTIDNAKKKKKVK